MEDLQQLFLQEVAQKLPAGVLLVKELMAILQVSKSEAYNKIKGRSGLTLNQVQVLCRHFEVNFTIPGLQQQHLSEVTFTPFQTGLVSMADHISNLKKTLAGIQHGKSVKITCATDDIPFFHLFRFPELTAFKLHFWQMRSTPNAPFYFDPADWATIANETKELYELYRDIPSVEIWTKSSLLNSLEQIKYARESGIIRDKALGKMICAQLREALSDIEKYAINHSKTVNGTVSFDWYFYEIIGSITYLVEIDGQLISFLRFNTFNTIQAVNQSLCLEVKQWLQALVADSIGFSGQGSVQRNRYLAAAYQGCDEIAATFD